MNEREVEKNFRLLKEQNEIQQGMIDRLTAHVLALQSVVAGVIRANPSNDQIAAAIHDESELRYSTMLTKALPDSMLSEFRSGIGLTRPLQRNPPGA